MRYPVTNEIVPSGEEQDGHIIPEACGGKRTVRTWKKIDNEVGHLFDCELIEWVEELKLGDTNALWACPNLSAER